MAASCLWSLVYSKCAWAQVLPIYPSCHQLTSAALNQWWVSTSRYLDDPYFEGMVNQIYALELHLNKANTSDTEALFLDLHLFLTVLYPQKFMTNAMILILI